MGTQSLAGRDGSVVVTHTAASSAANTRTTASHPRTPRTQQQRGLCVGVRSVVCDWHTHRGSHTALHQYENGMHTHEHSHHMCRAYITTQQPPPPFTCCFWSARARCAAANSSAFTFTSDLLACTCASKSVIARR